MQEERMENHIKQLKVEFQALSVDLNNLKREIYEVLESFNT